MFCLKLSLPRKQKLTTINNLSKKIVFKNLPLLLYFLTFGKISPILVFSKISLPPHLKEVSRTTNFLQILNKFQVTYYQKESFDQKHKCFKISSRTTTEKKKEEKKKLPIFLIKNKTPFFFHF